MGAAAVAEEATPKPGAHADCEGDAQGRKLARQEQPRDGEHHGHAIATYTAKKVTDYAAKITGIIWGAIAKASFNAHTHSLTHTHKHTHSLSHSLSLSHTHIQS